MNSLAARNIILILYRVYDSPQANNENKLIIIQIRNEIQQAIDNMIKLENDKDPSNATKLRNIKFFLIYLLNEAKTCERQCDQSLPWIFELLSPICYSLIVR